MGRVFWYFFEDLIAGDPVALTAAGVIAFVALLICLAWWRIARNLRKEEEQRKNRYGKPKRSP